MINFRSNPIVCSFMAVGLGLSSFSLFANDDEIGEISLSDLFNLDAQIWSVSRSEQKARKAPATAMVVSKTQIMERGYRDLSDILRDLPGFDIVEQAGRFGELNTIRGIDGNDRFLVLVDGHRINPYRGTFLSMGNSLSVHDAEQVEVVYGPASVVFGADAFSAIINIVTKSRELVDAQQMSVHFGIGDDGKKDMSLNGQLPLFNGQGDLRVSVRTFSADGLDLPSFDDIYANTDNGDYGQPVDDRNVNIRLNYDNASFGYFQQYFNQGNGVPHNPALYRHTPEGKWRLTTDVLWGSYGLELSDNSRVNFDLSYTEHIQHADSNFPKTPRQYFTGEDKTIKGSSVLNHSFDNDFELVAGIEFESTDSIPPYANDELFGTGNSWQFIGENERLIREVLTLSEQRQGLFAQLTMPINEQLTAFAGVRYDRSDVSDNSTNPRGGLVYQPSEDTTVKLLYGTAFQAPSLFFQYEQFSVPPTGLIMIPNTNLKNQKLSSYELSLTQKLGADNVLHVSVYHNDLTDLVFRGLSDETVPGFNTVLQNTNIGSQTAKGMDVRLDTAISERTTAYVNYSYIDADFELNGSVLPLARVSEHKLNAGVTTKLGDKTTVTAQLKYVGEMSTTPTNSKYTDGRKMPEFFELNAYARYQLNEQVSLFARLRNIADQTIEHGGIFGQSGIMAPTIYQPKFNYTFGVDAKF